MVKYLVLFSLISSLSLSGSAQYVRSGFKFGAQLSRPHYDDATFYDEYTAKYGLGFNVGGVVNWKASDNFALHTELLYSRINKHLVGTDGYSLNRDQFNYLTLPVLLRGSMPVGHAKVYLNAGPSVSYWLGGKGFVRHVELDEFGFETSHRIAFGEKERNETYTDEVVRITNANRIQLGLDMGTGVMIPLQDQYLMVDLRYSWGHTNMAQEDAQYLGFFGYNDDLSFANHSFSVSCAYLFEFDLVKLTRKGKITKSKQK